MPQQGTSKEYPRVCGDIKYKYFLLEKNSKKTTTTKKQQKKTTYTHTKKQQQQQQQKNNKKKTKQKKNTHTLSGDMGLLIDIVFSYLSVTYKGVLTYIYDKL